MSLILIPLVAFGASLLTFFSGFGLGTLLMPVFALFFPLEAAVAMTAVVHFLNNLFKLRLVGFKADRVTLLRFGVPGVGAALLGAWALGVFSGMEPLATYTLGGREIAILPAKAVVAAVMIFFTLFEILPALARLEFSPRLLPLGGLLSGFFGGLSGHQGALRSAFLARLKLSKEQFIGTNVAIACLIDVTRLSVYTGQLRGAGIAEHWGLVALATAAAFLGAYAGNRLLKKVTMDAVQKVVSICLLLLAVAIGLGLA